MENWRKHTIFADAKAKSGKSIHNVDERQALRYRALGIWTIFKTARITSNDAHASVYITSSPRNGGREDITSSVSFFTCFAVRQSRASNAASEKPALSAYTN